MTPDGKQPDGETEYDWTLLGILMDLQRGKIGNLTAQERVRKWALQQREEANG